MRMAIKLEVERFGDEAHWTMAAAAKEYRESLAIEEAILKNPDVQEDWLKHQMELVDVNVIEAEDIVSSATA